MAVLGPGLIGGSVLKALRERFPDIELTAWARREEAVDHLASIPGLVNLSTTDIDQATAGADLIILAMPTGAMETVVHGISPLPSAPGGRPVLVTDVGSVKAPVVGALSPLVRGKGAVFLGSHPMAGSEQVGLEHAEASLFEEAAVILTPGAGQESAAETTELALFWESLGARVSSMDASRHDELVAAISHLPHLLAASLVRVALKEDPGIARFSGGGFRDTTRVSSGPEDMWAGILADNSEAVARKLEELIRELEEWKEALDSLDRDRLRSFLSEARNLREHL